MFGKKKKENTAEETKTDIADVQATPQSIQINLNTSEQIQKEKKARFPLVVKVILGTLVVASAALLCYAVFLLINDSNTQSGKDNYITLSGKSIQESKDVYSQFGVEKKKKASDFALVGTKLYVSETKITPETLSIGSTAFYGEGSTNLFLYNVTLDQARFALGQSDATNHQYYIDLQNVEEGDFFIYSSSGPYSSRKDYHPYSLSTNESINYVSYTLPDKDGIRKRITLKNNKESPYLVLNISSCGSTLPTKYYDAVIFAAEYKENSSTYKKEASYTEEEWNSLITSIQEKIPERFKVKFASSLQDAYDTYAPVSISVSKEKGDYTSIYTKNDLLSFDTKTLSDGLLEGYDAIPEIREMTGYLAKAGENNLNVIGNDIQTSTTDHTGKESYRLSSSENIENKIVSILNK